MTCECLNDAETGTASSHRISRRAALVTGGVGLLQAVAGSSSPRSAEARQATPVADDDHELPVELQLALTDIVLSVLGDANVPGAIVLVSIPGQGMWSIAVGLGDVSNATPIRL